MPARALSDAEGAPWPLSGCWRHSERSSDLRPWSTGGGTAVFRFPQEQRCWLDHSAAGVDQAVRLSLLADGHQPTDTSHNEACEIAAVLLRFRKGKLVERPTDQDIEVIFA